MALTGMKKLYYIYIMSNTSRMLYTGVTNNLLRRVYEHKKKLVAGYTCTYNIHKLVYFDETDDISYALAREKELKGWRRAKKIELIESINPCWLDLAEGWYNL